jgi:trehalose/maltose transport system permease protein
MREQKIISLFKFFSAAFLLLFCLLPFAWMIVISLTKNPDFLGSNQSVSFTLTNYSDLLTSGSTHLLDYLKNSIIVSIISAFCATLFASLSAYAITRLSFPGKILIPLILLAFSMFPQISIIGYLFKLMTWLGWINTYYALIFPYITLGLPLALWIMLSYLSRLSTELDKAALIDGASRWQILQKIIFPIALPGAFSTFMLILIYSFNEFLFALMLTIDYKARTIPVGIALFEGLHGQVPWGYIMASAVIAVVPLIILIAFFQKYIIQGLTEGAIKG